MTQLEAGITVEHEHKPTYEWLMKYIMDNNDFPELEDFAKHISEDHLNEHADYYTILNKAGLAEELHKNTSNKKDIK